MAGFMRRLTLIRHGITEWNAQGRFQGSSDVPLTEEGRWQAGRLRAASGVRVEPVDALVASPSRRARETAALAFPDRPLETDARLQELDFGVFEGRTLDENMAHPAWGWWTLDPYRRPAPRGESYRALQRRAASWLDDARSRWTNAHVVAVCHAGTIQMLLAHLLGVDEPRWNGRLEVGHTALCAVRFDDDLTIVERVNDRQHLVDPELRGD